MPNQHLDPSATALLLVDFINDIVSEGGKLAGKGYLTYIREHKIDERVGTLLGGARRAGWSVVHVRVGFSKTYADHPASSPLFGGAKKFGALALGGWGTEFAGFAQPLEDEVVVVKHRVSAFYGTDLEAVLRSLSVRNIVIAGCATDLAVQSAARDAHDRDFAVIVVDDACAAATKADHQSSLTVLAKIATIVTVADLARPPVSAT